MERRSRSALCAGPRCYKTLGALDLGRLSLITLFRVLVGAVVYSTVVVLAAPFPGAAGMMLIFPALNGLGFLFAKQASIGAMAKSMLWMPAINGSLCASYIILFLSLAGTISPTVLAWGLFATVMLAWMLIASRKKVRDGIPEEYQFRCGVIFAVAGMLFTGTACLLQNQGHFAPSINISEQSIMPWKLIEQTIWQTRFRIGLFAVCLLVFLLSVRYLPISEEDQGVLAGLPIVPFGGLVSVAGDGAMEIGGRVQILDDMLIGVWLAPAIAIWFIYGLSRYLTARQTLPVQLLDDGMRFLILIMGWALCGIAISAITCVLTAVA